MYVTHLSVSTRIVLLLLKIITEYCQCADDLPMLVNEIMSKLIEILKVSSVYISPIFSIYNNTGVASSKVMRHQSQAIVSPSVHSLDQGGHSNEVNLLQFRY